MVQRAVIGANQDDGTHRRHDAYITCGPFACQEGDGPAGDHDR